MSDLQLYDDFSILLNILLTIENTNLIFSQSCRKGLSPPFLSYTHTHTSTLLLSFSPRDSLNQFLGFGINRTCTDNEIIYAQVW